METIFTAILAAVKLGVKKIGEKAIVDGYNGLKKLLKKKFGGDSEVIESVEKLEEKPDSEGRSQTLAEELKAVEADRDAEIVSAAQVLLNRINAHPDGRKIVAKLKGSGAIAVGDGAVAAGAGGVAVGGDVHGNVHTSGRKEKDK